MSLKSALIFQGLPTLTAHALRLGMPDANGQPAEYVLNPYDAAPCRHCLNHVPKGQGMLICGHRPFSAPQPYAETGPIFLCAADCAPYRGESLPEVLTSSPDYLVKGYGADERIVYGTGRVTPRGEIESYCAELLARDGIAFVDIRSARNNCWQVRVTG
ncbi:DUF1203 domain-containing protein [Celeribacter neptunius]|uniref:DUF1203 domain-containing protein n=1 Tax=Celeribacter neptunius TaxID=588602 RepID=A0A1I3K652_9RHOB|nr:DUF1203 domain-containing protein [Celeribacter neptunius]SFI67993.1 Protein of unknown function [Celeribacter neptunius]